MTAGYGEFDATCPEGDGHVWEPPRKGAGRKCVQCGVNAREFMAAATAARSEFFSGLRAPASAHGKVKKQ